MPLSEYLFDISFNCPAEPSDDEYYNKVYVLVDGVYPFSFMLDCDEGVRHKKFEFGYIVIAALNAVIMLSVALHSRIWSYKYKGN